MLDVPATLNAIAGIGTPLGVILIGYWAYKGKADFESAKIDAEAARVAAEAAKADAALARADMILTKDGVFEIGKKVDGRLSELIEEIKKSSKAEGKAEGLAAGKLETLQAMHIPSVPQAAPAPVVIVNPDPLPVAEVSLNASEPPPKEP